MSYWVYAYGVVILAGAFGFYMAYLGFKAKNKLKESEK